MHKKKLCSTKINHNQIAYLSKKHLKASTHGVRYLIVLTLDILCKNEKKTINTCQATCRLICT